MESLVSAIKTERCPDCGAPVAGARAGCQALQAALAAPGSGELGLSAQRALTFDAYCLQHPDTYRRSAKSYAAHLTRLFCGLEHGADPKVYRAIQRWVNGAVALEKPEVLSERGRMTVADLQAAASPAELARLAQAWAGNVWQAYAPQHDMARRWIRLALGVGETAKSRPGAGAQKGRTA